MALLVFLAGLVGPLGLNAPSIDLPSVEVPPFPAPNIAAPGWLRAIGEAIDGPLSVLAPAIKYMVAAVVVILGVRRTREVRRKRTAAEQVGREELLRRLAVALTSVEATARAHRATTIREAFDESRAPPARGLRPLAGRAAGAPTHESETWRPPAPGTSS